MNNHHLSPEEAADFPPSRTVKIPVGETALHTTTCDFNTGLCPRGKSGLRFRDMHGAPCRLQVDDTSNEKEGAIWFGPVVASPTINYGSGPVPYGAIPDDVHLTTDMNLSADQVGQLLPHLLAFHRHGVLKPEGKFYKWVALDKLPVDAGEDPLDYTLQLMRPGSTERVGIDQEPDSTEHPFGHGLWMVDGIVGDRVLLRLDYEQSHRLHHEVQKLVGTLA